VYVENYLKNPKVQMRGGGIHNKLYTDTGTRLQEVLFRGEKNNSVGGEIIC
jgi:hypothetical protein